MCNCEGTGLLAIADRPGTYSVCPHLDSSTLPHDVRPIAGVEVVYLRGGGCMKGRTWFERCTTASTADLPTTRTDTPSDALRLEEKRHDDGLRPRPSSRPFGPAVDPDQGERRRIHL